jgi:hypothetical protein
MKKYILLFTAICIVILSCKKDKATKPANQDGKLYPINFNVSGFTQTQEPAISASGKRLAADTPLNAILPYLQYRLYTPEGILIKKFIAKRSNADFGKFTDSLATGNYTAVFLGYLQKSTTVLDEAPDDVLTAAGRIFGPLEETVYYKKINFSVPATSVQNIALERVSAALQLVIKDPIPSNVRLIDVTYNDYNGFSVFKDQPIWYWDFENSENNTQYISIDHSFSTKINVPAGTSNFTTSVWPYILNTVTPIEMTIAAYEFDNSSTIRAKKTLNVMFYRNTKTILTGRLFSNDAADEGFKTTLKYNFAADSISSTF